MANRKKPSSNDFEARFFDQMDDRFDRVETKLDKNTEEIRTLAPRVSTLENKISAVGPKWYDDKKLLYIAGICLMVFLLIIAAVLGVNIPKGVL